MNDIETVFTTLFRLKSTFAEKRIIVRPKSAMLTSLSGSNLPSDALTIPLPTAYTAALNAGSELSRSAKEMFSVLTSGEPAML